MKKIIAFLLIISIAAMLTGCFDEPLYDVTYPKPVVVEPDEDTAYNINGYKDTKVTSSTTENVSSDDTSSSISNAKYVGNKNSKKLHTAECSYAKRINDENIILFENLEDAKSKGYVSCSRCLG